MDSQQATKLLAKIREAQEKRANDPLTALQQVAQKGIKQEALSDIGKVMLFAGGTGAALRGGYGLLNLLKRNVQPRPVDTHTELPLPIPAEEDEEAQLSKAAAFGDSYFGSPVTKKEGLYWRMPGMLLGGLAAGGIGWGVVDKILDSRRKQEIEDELEGSKERFRQAMISSYDRPAKLAGDEDPEMTKLADDLDALFDQFEKMATAGDWVGDKVGLYGMYAAPAALLAGYAAYSATKKRQRAAILNKALKKRQRRRHMLQPSELYATPTPVSLPGVGTEEEQEAA